MPLELSKVEKSDLKEALTLDDGLVEVIEAVAKGDIRDFRKSDHGPAVMDVKSDSVGRGSLSDGASLPKTVPSFSSFSSFTWLIWLPYPS